MDFTPREFEVVRLVVQGLPNRKIAAELCITVSTVKFHLERIFDKTGCRSKRDLQAKYGRDPMFGGYVDSGMSPEPGDARFALRPISAGDLETVLAIQACAYPDLVREGDQCWNDDELKLLTRRFPPAVLLFEDRGRPRGYLCSFPISPRTAASVINADLSRRLELPGICGENEIFNLPEVLTRRHVKTTDFAWYIDGVALLPDTHPISADYALLCILHKAITWFSAWEKRPPTQVISITDRKEGEQLMGIASRLLSRFGFGEFVNVWTYEHDYSSPRPWRCWASTYR